MKMPRPFPKNLLWRLMEALLVLLDTVRLPGLMLRINQWAKPNTRPLTEKEAALAYKVFGNNLQYSKIRIDERAHIGCRHGNFAYVGFFCINAWGQMNDVLLIHELVHVWQYQRVGSRYIPRALYAQQTPEGYNYGGPKAIRWAIDSGKGMDAFNYEQQADLVADYFCLLNGLLPKYCPADQRLLPLFKTLLRPVLAQSSP